MVRTTRRAISTDTAGSRRTAYVDDVIEQVDKLFKTHMVTSDNVFSIDNVNTLNSAYINCINKLNFTLNLINEKKTEIIGANEYASVIRPIFEKKFTDNDVSTNPYVCIHDVIPIFEGKYEYVYFFEPSSVNDNTDVFVKPLNNEQRILASIYTPFIELRKKYPEQSRFNLFNFYDWTDYSKVTLSICMPDILKPSGPWIRILCGVNITPYFPYITSVALIPQTYKTYLGKLQDLFNNYVNDDYDFSEGTIYQFGPNKSFNTLKVVSSIKYPQWNNQTIVSSYIPGSNIDMPAVIYNINVELNRNYTGMSVDEIVIVQYAIAEVYFIGVVKMIQVDGFDGLCYQIQEININETFPTSIRKIGDVTVQGNLDIERHNGEKVITTDNTRKIVSFHDKVGINQHPYEVNGLLDIDNLTQQTVLDLFDAFVTYSVNSTDIIAFIRYLSIKSSFYISLLFEETNALFDYKNQCAVFSIPIKSIIDPIDISIIYNEAFDGSIITSDYSFTRLQQIVKEVNQMLPEVEKATDSYDHTFSFTEILKSQDIKSYMTSMRAVIDYDDADPPSEKRLIFVMTCLDVTNIMNDDSTEKPLVKIMDYVSREFRFMNYASLLFKDTSLIDINAKYTTDTNGVGNKYRFNGGEYNDSSNPVLTFTRGSTYNLTINAEGHPFYIQTTPDNGEDYQTANNYNDGISNIGSQNGVITFIVPDNAPDTLYYRCGIHSGMGNTINIVSGGANYNVDVYNDGNGNKYRFNGGEYNDSSSPVLTFVRGSTYKLDINAVGHPFYIQTTSNWGSYDSSNQYIDGISSSSNSGSQNVVITFIVPDNAPDTLYYRCGINSGMGNTINIVSRGANYNVDFHRVSSGYIAGGNINLSKTIQNNPYFSTRFSLRPESYIFSLNLSDLDKYVIMEGALHWSDKYPNDVWSGDNNVQVVVDLINGQNDKLYNKRQDSIFVVNYRWRGGRKISFTNTIRVGGNNILIGSGFDLNSLLDQSMIVNGDNTISGNFFVNDSNNNNIFKVDNVNKTITNSYKVGIGVEEPKSILDIKDTTVTDVLNEIDAGIEEYNILNKVATKMRDNAPFDNTTIFANIIDGAYSDLNIEQTHNNYISLLEINMNTMLAGDVKICGHWLFSHWNGQYIKNIQDPVNQFAVNVAKTVMTNILNTELIYDNALILTHYKHVFGWKFSRIRCLVIDEKMYMIRIGTNIQDFGLRPESNANLVTAMDNAVRGNMLTNRIHSYMNNITMLNDDESFNELRRLNMEYKDIPHNTFILTMDTTDISSITIQDVEIFDVPKISSDKLQELFDLFDTDGDGYLSNDELINFSSASGYDFSDLINTSYLDTAAQTVPDPTAEAIAQGLSQTLLPAMIAFNNLTADGGFNPFASFTGPAAPTASVSNNDNKISLDNIIAKFMPIQYSDIKIVSTFNDYNVIQKYKNFWVKYSEKQYNMPMNDFNVIHYDDLNYNYITGIKCINTVGNIKTFLCDELRVQDVIKASLSVEGDAKITGDLMITNKSTGENYMSIDPVTKYIGIGTDERFISYQDIDCTTCNNIWTSQHNVYIKHDRYPVMVSERIRESPIEEDPDFNSFGSYTGMTVKRKSRIYDFNAIHEYATKLHDRVINTNRPEDTVTHSRYGPDISFEVCDKTNRTVELGQIQLSIDSVDPVTGYLKCGFGVGINDFKEGASFVDVRRQLLYVDNDSQLFVQKINLKGGVLSSDDGINLFWNGKKVLTE
jgi:Ca2+-binding EF-hand superfamily protein